MKRFLDFIKEISSEPSNLEEALITLGGKAYPKFGNIVIMAGGAGSGKGFVKDKLLGIEGMTFDVDQLKLLSTKIPSIIDRVKKEEGIDLKDFDVSKNKYALKDPEKVSKLHHIIANVLELDRAKLRGIINAILMAPADRKPNIIFDVTMKDMKQFNKYTKQFQDYGYDKKNIHLVWVINDVKIAKEQNEKRARTVPIEILVQTHAGAALTMKEVTDMGNDVRKYMDGDIVFAFNKVDVDSSLAKSQNKNTSVPALFKSGKEDDYGVGQYILDANYVYVKRAGKPVDENALTKDIMSKISSYVPTAAYGKEVANVVIKNTQKVWKPKKFKA